MATQDEEKLPDDAAPDAITDNQVPNVEARDVDDDDSPDAPEPNQDRPTRKERRANRYAEAMERARNAEDKATQIEARLRQMEYAQQQMRQNPLPAYQPPQTQPQDDGGLKRIYDLQENIVYRLRTDQGLSPDQQAQLANEHRRLDEQRFEVIARRTNPAPRQQQANPAEEQTRFENMQLRSEFPEVFGNEKMRMEAMAELHGMMESGKPANYQSAREAAKIIAAKYKKTEYSPSESQKAKFGGTPSRAGATGQGGATGSTRPSPMQMRLARKMYPGDDDQGAWDKWYRNIGKPNGLV